MVLDPEHTVYAVSHQFKYDSSIFICKFDYPETRCREEESIKPSTGSCKSLQKSWKQKDHLPNEKAINKIRGERGEQSKQPKKEQDIKKKSIVNSTRGSWQDKEEEGNVQSTRGQDKCGKDLG